MGREQLPRPPAARRRARGQGGRRSGPSERWWCAAAFVVALALGACASDTATSSSEPEPAPSDAPAAPLTTTSAAAAPVTTDGVLVVLTGIVTERGGLCPATMSSGCASQVVVDPPGLDGLHPGDVVRIEGRYDGHRLTTTSPAEAVVAALPDGTPIVPSPCLDLHDDAPLDAATLHSIAAALEADDAPLKELSYDSDQQIFTWWFTADEERAAAFGETIADLAGGRPVCVVGGGPPLPADAPSLASAVADLLADPTHAAPNTHGSFDDGAPLLIGLDALDQVGRAALDAYLPWVRPSVFLEVPDPSLDLDDLPPYVGERTGTIDLLTATDRGSEGLGAAIDTATLRYDPDGNCVFFERQDGTRLVPLWPFGSTADVDTITGEPVVRDAAGIEVARGGTSGMLGGGSLQQAPPEGYCGGTDVWLVHLPA